MKQLLAAICLFSALLTSSEARDRAFCQHDHVSMPKIFQPPSNRWDISDHVRNMQEFKEKLERTVPAKNFSIGLKILFLSATSDELNETPISLVRVTMDAFGIPYEHINLTDKGVKKSNRPFELYDVDGNPKYYGIIFTTNDLVYQDSQGLYVSALSPDERDEVNSYMKKYSVRKISLFSFPNPSLGVKYLSELSSTAANTIISTRLAEQNDPSLNSNLKFPITEHWHYSAQALPDGLKITPFLHYQNGSLAASITDFGDGREELHFFFAQSQYTKVSLVLSASWINWLTRGLYQGKRRVLMNAQIDDLFLETDLWNPYIGRQVVDNSFVYRTMADDMQFFSDWQKSYLRPRTLDPQFKIEHAFNGRGVWKNGGYYADSLFHKSIELRDEFNWLTHTFTHPTLDFLPHSVVDWQLKANIEIAKDMFDGDLDYKTFSKNSIVSPKISGLFNPHSIEAMLDNDIQHATGDNTRPELVESLFSGHYTTAEKHGFPGLYIIPRHSTVIYYNVSRPNELTNEYNFIYHNHFGRDSTFEEIITREVDRVSRYLLNYEPSPYMFHQANLRTFPWKGKRHTLVGLWMEEIIEELRKFHRLPILSMKMDKLVEHFKQRSRLANCTIDAKVLVQNKAYKKIFVANPDQCVVPFTTIAREVKNAPVEQYGPDRTFYIESTVKEITLQ
jgi:hypothetical protein